MDVELEEEVGTREVDVRIVRSFQCNPGLNSRPKGIYDS